MPMSPNKVIDLARGELWTAHKADRQVLDSIDDWLRNEPPAITLPRTATRETHALRELARTPWLSLVVSVQSQATLVDGYRSPDGDAGDDSPSSRAWRIWEANDFDARQVILHRDAYGYGLGYAVGLPGRLPDGRPMPVLRPVSPRRMIALYADPAGDDWPMSALEVIPQPNGYAWRVYDEEVVHYLSADRDGQNVTYLEWRAHGSPVPPVVRYTPRIDSEGRTLSGSVHPFVAVAERINKTTFDRLLAQHFTGWQVRTIAGMTAPDDDEAANRKKLELRQDDILVADDPDTKFGTLPPTPLDGLLNAEERDVETLAATSQTPTHALTGTLINLSAEALAAARAQLEQKLAESKTSLGKSHAQLLRLGATIMGDNEAAGDYMARVTFQDTSIRSLSSAADALGKVATQLGVPVQALWSMVPGVTKSDVLEWQRMAESADPLTKLGDHLEQQAAALAAGGLPPSTTPPAPANAPAAG